MSIVSILYLLGIAVLAVFFYGAMMKTQLKIFFFVVLMAVAATIAIAGMNMLSDSDLRWVGVSLSCFGLMYLLASAVACLLLCKK